jgi:sugar/nucleoside kinase (ribokinase family)
MVERFLDAGASIVAIRMGPSGSLLASQASPQPLYTPAAQAQILDVTGCGNVFNGALLAALQRGCPLVDAAAWGSAAAAFMAEAEGKLCTLIVPYARKWSPRRFHEAQL